MGRYLRAIFISGFFILFLSIGVQSVYADCDIAPYNPFNNTMVPAGTRMCGNFKNWIEECQADGSWKNYYNCSALGDSCQDLGTPPNSAAKCSKDAGDPQPVCVSNSKSASIGQKLCFSDSTNIDRANVVQCVSNRNADTWASFDLGHPLQTCNKNDCSEATPGQATCIIPTATPTPTPVSASTECPEITLANGQKMKLKPNEEKCIDRDNTGTENIYIKCKNDASGYDQTRCDTGFCATGGNAPCGGPSPTPTPDECSASGSIPSGQQAIPRPGVNCGIPDKDPLPEGATENARACCYSALAREKVVSLSCFISLPGADGVIKGLSNKLNDFIDKTPFWFKNDYDPNIMTYAEIRNALEKIEPCVSGSTQYGKEPGSTDFNLVDNTSGCRCQRPTEQSLAWYCNQITGDNDPLKPDERDECIKCMTKIATDGSGNVIVENGKEKRVAGNGIWTAIGCVDISNENGFVQQLLNLGVILGAAFSVLCNIYAAFLYQTSMGKPESLNKARSLILSCITGLLLMVFAIFILNLIGYKILRLPGLG